MKTLLTRIKEDIQNDSNLALVIKGVQVVAPDYLPDISISLLPFIGIAPMGTSESWHSTARKEVIHIVKLYLVHRLQIQETAIMGSASDRGLLDTQANLDSVVRSKFFPRDGLAYLSKPSEITNIDYSLGSYGDQVFSIIAAITLQCPRLIDVTVVSS